jgi:hypothetical protein
MHLVLLRGVRQQRRLEESEETHAPARGGVGGVALLVVRSRGASIPTREARSVAATPMDLMG